MKLIKGDSFFCCCPYDDGTNRILLGTIRGYIFEGYLEDEEIIRQAVFSDDSWFRVLGDSFREIIRLGGIIRSIKKLSKNKFIILSHEGAIITYSISTEAIHYIQDDKFNKYQRTWRLQVIDESTFITAGNYNNISLWKKEEGKFNAISIKDNGGAIFCLDYFSRSDDLILANNYGGNTDLIRYEDENTRIQNQFLLSRNLQSFSVLENEFIVAVDYFGIVHVYKIEENDIQRLDEYSISSYRGNHVHISEELNQVLIGTDEHLILLNKELDEIKIIKLIVKQIFNYKGMDLILTNSTIIRDDYRSQFQPDFLAKFKYIKIGLVGDSQVGKTCFCKYLETNEFVDTASSFGKHVWTIPLRSDHNKKILYYDLAGQDSELFTYFPMINDADIILIFYQGIKKTTFDIAIAYYEELREKCPKSTFYFIQTFADQAERVSDEYIRSIFTKFNLNFEEQLIKVSPKTEVGFNEYNEKVLNLIKWDNAPSILKSAIYEIVENKIHELFNEGYQTVSLKKFSKAINLRSRIVEKIILAYKRQGMVEYLEKNKEIILNDEEYEIIHSKIAGLIEEKSGYVEVNLILERLADTERKTQYINNIIDFYRDNQVGIFFKEGIKNKEVLIFKRKLLEYIPEDLKNDISDTGIRFNYSDVLLRIDSIIRFLSQFDLEILHLSSHEIILVHKDVDNPIYIILNHSYNFLDRNKRLCGIFFNKRTNFDYQLEIQLTEFFMEQIGDNITDFQMEETIDKEILNLNSVIMLKYILKYTYEKPYFDFKKIIDITDNNVKAKLLKNIISLANSAYLNNNISYLAIGIEEEDQKVKAIVEVEDKERIENVITNLMKNYVNVSPSIECIPIPINEIFKWQQDKEISPKIPFTEEQKSKDYDKEILLVKIMRHPNTVYEISKKFNYKDNNIIKELDIADSWIRISSHTYKLRENQRQILRVK